MTLGSLFLLLLVSDQLTKLWAVETLKGAPPRHYLQIFTLTYAENTGGWGSLGANWHPFARRALLIAAPTLVLALLGYYLVKNEEFDWTRAAGYVCIMAGGAGNLIDRFRLDYVIDFLYVGYGAIGTNIFNIADMAIMLGFFLVLLRSWGSGSKEDGSDGSAQPLEGGVKSVGSEA